MNRFIRNLLYGAGSVLDILPETNTRSVSKRERMSVQEALAGDFKRIGEDMRHAIKGVKVVDVGGVNKDILSFDHQVDYKKIMVCVNAKGVVIRIGHDAVIEDSIANVIADKIKGKCGLMKVKHAR